jgi:hypothetical protein
LTDVAGTARGDLDLYNDGAAGIDNRTKCYSVCSSEVPSLLDVAKGTKYHSLPMRCKATEAASGAHRKACHNRKSGTAPFPKDRRRPLLPLT